MLIFLFVLLFSLIIIGFPIVFAIGIASLTVMILEEVPIYLIVITTFSGVNRFTLMAIPFFILAGFIMDEAGIINQIVSFSKAIVGHLRGGLGHVNILASMIFAGTSGSGVADASAIGSILIPSMVKEGYSSSYSTSVTATAATIGPIIPPSIPFVLYGIITRVSIGSLFIAGVIPGIILGVGFMIMNYYQCLKRGYDFREERKNLKTIVKTFKSSFPALIMPIIILGGIVTGTYTATEAGVTAVVYGFIYGIFFSKSLKLKDIPRILIAAAERSGIVMYIISMSSIFSQVLSRLHFQQIILAELLKISENPFVILIVIMIFLILLGCFLDPVPMIILFAPTLSILGGKLGFHPIHFGVFIVITMLVGAVTPPVGTMLFVSCSIAKIDIEETFDTLFPFILVIILTILLILFIPSLTIWLPSLFHF